MSETSVLHATSRPAPTPLRLVDADVHHSAHPGALTPYLEQRWVDYLNAFGVRTRHETDTRPALRPFAARADAIPPCGVAGGDPDFARAQLLDPYGIDIAILNSLIGQIQYSGGNAPVPFCEALERANNDWTHTEWLQRDPRWRASIACQYDSPEIAVREVERCRSLSDRFLQILASTRTERPFGHSKYWPLFEIATHYDIPIAFHPGGSGSNQLSGSGWPSYYFENHLTYPFGALSHVASLVFEGVFDRWPTLKIVFVEGGWSWVAPYAARLDATYAVQRAEVAHLQRKPSEYLAEHFWFTTQPFEEPPKPRWLPLVYEQFAEAGLDGRLMFSSDYPHWDFDSPAQAIPRTLPEPVRRGLQYANAAALYGFPLVPGAE
ncbi:amidohydrolase family protein [Pseudonocardia sp. KRD291]|uniref:amidohydrolase family protein n=1 Tax=Pseudonocardia sp. KRD291 TaxID=2792007 RepID=UPI001C4A2CEB|nr:amidohydrolase family protein [Pseudonocardia sp. KRD291]MBW0101028.1 amidohydrolase [Pseudonocardia sp. KRD291]